MPEVPFKLSQVSVVMLGVEDVARSVAFYRDKLGLTVKFQFEGFVFLDGGGVMLVLNDALARASQHIVGATQVVFGVSDVRRGHRALAARGRRLHTRAVASHRDGLGRQLQRPRRPHAVRLRTRREVVRQTFLSVAPMDRGGACDDNHTSRVCDVNDCRRGLRAVCAHGLRRATHGRCASNRRCGGGAGSRGEACRLTARSRAPRHGRILCP